MRSFKAASVARQAKSKKLNVKSGFIITPGSEQIRYTAERDGLLDAFAEIGGVIMANACGPVSVSGPGNRMTRNGKIPSSLPSTGTLPKGMTECRHPCIYCIT